MSTLLVAEHVNNTLKDSTSKALTAAKAIGADVHVLVARYYAMLGMKPEALGHLTLALNAVPTDPHYLVIAAVALVALAVFLYVRFSRATPAIARNSIAVLPLVNATNDSNSEYLSDGISESLINSLTELREQLIKNSATLSPAKGEAVRQIETYFADSLVTRLDGPDSPSPSEIRAAR